MKNNVQLTIIFLMCLCAAQFSLQAQAPQQLNYQAVVRNSSGQPLANGTHVSVRFQIHDGTPTGTVVYLETASLTTNQFGLVTYAIGSGANLSTVSWSTGAKYLEVDMDPNGGNSYSDMGTSQLLSVPYALFAGNSAAGPIGPTGLQGVTGAAGNVGATGATGIGVAGVTGANGATGATGNNGNNGVTGPTGNDGPTGLPGVNGTNGATGINGSIGATGPTGNDGATGLNGATGANGNDGATGANGSNGATGPTGNNGATGLNGTNGATGANGARGQWQ